MGLTPESPECIAMARKMTWEPTAHLMDLAVSQGLSWPADHGRNDRMG